MDEIFKCILDKLADADLWIALSSLAVGVVCWLWIGTKRREQKVLRCQIGVAIILALLAGAAMLVNHAVFQREPVFSKKRIGILVMRMEGDDASNSLQGELMDNLNVELQNDPTGKQIEVHAGRKTIDQNDGIGAAHERARAIGQSVRRLMGGCVPARMRKLSE